MLNPFWSTASAPKDPGYSSKVHALHLHTIGTPTVSHALLQAANDASSDSGSGSDMSDKAGSSRRTASDQAVKAPGPAVPNLKLGGKPTAKPQSNGRGSDRRSPGAAIEQLRLPAPAPRYADLVRRGPQRRTRRRSMLIWVEDS